MEEKITGWAIVNIGHPNTGSKSIVTDSFRLTKRRAIKDFIGEGGSAWRYWHDKYNFRAVRSTLVIKTEK